MRDYRQLIIELFGQPGNGDSMLVMDPAAPNGFRQSDFIDGQWRNFDLLGLKPGMEVLYTFGLFHPQGEKGNRQFTIPADTDTQVTIATTGGYQGEAVPADRRVTLSPAVKTGLGIGGVLLLAGLVWYLWKHHGRR